jgi:hypothetical protein
MGGLRGFAGIILFCGMLFVCFLLFLSFLCFWFVCRPLVCGPWSSSIYIYIYIYIYILHSVCLCVCVCVCVCVCGELSSRLPFVNECSVLRSSFRSWQFCSVPHRQPGSWAKQLWRMLTTRRKHIQTYINVRKTLWTYKFKFINIRIQIIKIGFWKLTNIAFHIWQTPLF